MLPAPSIVCRVVRPIDAPVPARVGDVLSVWPGHPTHTLCVLAGDLIEVRTRRHVADRALYPALFDLFLDGAICLPVESQRALLGSAVEAI